MPKTVEDILRESGLSPEEIKALDSKILSGVGNVLNASFASEQAASQAKEQAELTMRAQKQMLETEINPALDSWATEKANLEAQVAFYRTQNESARTGGFVPQDAPGFKAPAQGADGRFVANQNPVPGSPQYITPEQAFKAVSNASWLTNEHLRLYGTPPPDDMETLLQEANDNRFDLRTWAGRKYNFEGKRKEAAEKAQQEHDSSIAKKASEERDKYWAERQSGNPNLSPAVASQFSELNKAVSGGQRKDPLSMSATERHQATRSAIMTEIAQRDTVQ